MEDYNKLRHQLQKEEEQYFILKEQFDKMYGSMKRYLEEHPAPKELRRLATEVSNERILLQKQFDRLSKHSLHEVIDGRNEKDYLKSLY